MEKKLLQIREITEGTPGYNCDETEFLTLNRVPFTGVFREFHNGNLSSVISYCDGIQRGYYVWYYTVGASIGAVQVIAEVDGIHVSYDEAGAIKDIRKYCCGRILERMRIVNRIYLVDEVLNRHQQNDLFDNPINFAKYCRRETIQELYEEVMGLFSRGTLFDEEWLYTEDGYYNRIDERLS